MLKGETSITRIGAKYLSPDHGQKNATPRPPLVKESRIPCDAVGPARTKLYQHFRERGLSTVYRLCLRLVRLVRSLPATPPRTQGSIRGG